MALCTTTYIYLGSSISLSSRAREKSKSPLCKAAFRGRKNGKRNSFTLIPRSEGRTFIYTSDLLDFHVGIKNLIANPSFVVQLQLFVLYNCASFPTLSRHRCKHSGSVDTINSLRHQESSASSSFSPLLTKRSSGYLSESRKVSQDVTKIRCVFPSGEQHVSDLILALVFINLHSSILVLVSPTFLLLYLQKEIC